MIKSENQNKGVIMQIVFKRRLTNELLTTYLPSFFLLGICYSTIHFKSFYFEAGVTVNLTVMLVATTLFVRFVETRPNGLIVGLTHMNHRTHMKYKSSY